ncbi:hypothetical protein [Nafulsella turpanensis]|uniref:hypothetical protein n=1 Tax=Nafulsella turpanensis TaxID=1265690 RepID=UPI00034C631F|nr:hypothetical protein [Nafulsella turpanensis]
MKNVILIATFLLLIIACGKEETTQEVKFAITGTSVTEVKFNYKSSIQTINTPFDGTWDTTIVANIGETISLDSKATGGALKGQVFINGTLVTEEIDADTDGDGKTQIKVNWTTVK